MTAEYISRSTQFTVDGIKDILCMAVRDLYQKEPDIDNFSSESGQTEWNLTAHLGPEIIKYFPNYSYDVDITKINYNHRRPDIIIHRRGSGPEGNLLIVEAKRHGMEREVREDESKIRQYWFSERLRYRYGATMNLKPACRLDVNVFSNPGVTGT